jgi:predicted TPR repeat methyltransferase
MGKNRPEFYDDDVIFETYMSGRETRVDSPNETLEKPVFDELVGNVTNLRILDLGCGNAVFGLEALQQGCHSYLGIDDSKKMVEAAKEKLTGTHGTVMQASIEDWQYPVRQFDLVTSQLALHYIAEIAPVFAKVYAALVEGGRFVFSIEHPVITSCDRAWQTPVHGRICCRRAARIAA